MDRREVDYVILGAGIAGMTLQRMLPEGSAVLLDPAPGGAPVGWAISSQHFAHPLVRPLAETAAALPSAGRGDGTIFASADGAGWYGPSSGQATGVHVERAELERAAAEYFRARVTRERVLGVDAERGLVQTDAGTWAARTLVVDCSGVAQIVARALGIAREVWPVWAAYAYHDVVDVDVGRFWEHTRGLPVWVRLRSDAMRLVTARSPDEFDPRHAALVTQVTEDTWTWQTPLARGRRLGIGVLSRRGPVDEATYDQLARRTLAPQYRVEPLRRDGTEPHERFHVVERFAWASERFAGERWALLGDAAFFGDPIFGVGTAIATNQAIRLGTLLAGSGWSAARAEEHHERTARLWRRVLRAYQHWASGNAMSWDEEVDIDLDGEFLAGHLFQVRAATAYADMQDAASPADALPGGAPMRAARGRSVTIDVSEWLSGGSLAGWTLEDARANDSHLVLDWSHPEGEPLRVLVTSAIVGERYYSEVGGLGLRYQRSSRAQDSLDERARALMVAVAGLVNANGSRLRELL